MHRCSLIAVSCTEYVLFAILGTPGHTPQAVDPLSQAGMITVGNRRELTPP